MKRAKKIIFLANHDVGMIQLPCPETVEKSHREGKADGNADLLAALALRPGITQ
jgi:predicted secreted protein